MNITVTNIPDETRNLSKWKEIWPQLLAAPEGKGLRVDLRGEEVRRVVFALQIRGRAIERKVRSRTVPGGVLVWMDAPVTNGDSAK